MPHFLLPSQLMEFGGFCSFAAEFETLKLVPGRIYPAEDASPDLFWGRGVAG